MYKFLPHVGIGGQVVDVELNDVAYCGDDTNVADFTSQLNLIRIATETVNGDPRSLDYLNQTLWHEYIEAIKEYYGCKFDHDDVDRIAQGVHQILKQYGLKLIEVL